MWRVRIGDLTMRSAYQLPKRIPSGTKYVLEGRGPLVRRYIEFPNGRRIELSPRKALTCACTERQTTLVPEQNAVIDTPANGRRIFA
jgi:hypothetical protein